MESFWKRFVEKFCANDIMLCLVWMYAVCLLGNDVERERGNPSAHKHTQRVAATRNAHESIESVFEFISQHLYGCYSHLLRKRYFQFAHFVYHLFFALSISLSLSLSQSLALILAGSPLHCLSRPHIILCV